jgi:hypothetical protein
MSDKNKVIEFIKMALSKLPNEITRSFYYDKLNHTFFVIHITDYFMLNEDLEIDASVEVSMSDESQKEIVELIKRVEKNDNFIIRVPQKGIIDEELKHIEFLDYVNTNDIDLDLARIQSIEEKLSVKFDLETIDTKGKKWWEFWK